MIRAIVLSLLIAMASSGCKTLNINPPMKQPHIFYTQEGSPYVIRSVSQNVQGFVVPSTVVSPVVANVNFGSANTSLGTLYLATSKRMIPISFGFSVTNLTSGLNAVVDISSIYCSSVRLGQTPALTVEAQKSQIKLFPYADQIFITNKNLYAFNIRYNQVVFNDSDFIDPTGGISFRYIYSRAGSFTGNVPTGENPVIPAGTYNMNVNFLYAEML